MAREEQQVLGGFEQKKIAAIERWAAKYDATRETINGLEGELENHALKLREAVHANEDAVDKQENDDGDKLLVYRRGDINVVVKRGKEKVNVKIADKSKGSCSFSFATACWCRCWCGRVDEKAIERQVRKAEEKPEPAPKAKATKKAKARR